MQRLIVSVSIAVFTMIAVVASGEEPAKLFLEAGDFPTLDSFESTEAFEAHIGEYEQQCRDEWISSSLGSKCGVEADVWDRELNLAYSALMVELSPGATETLRSSQRKWMAFRDETMLFNQIVLQLHYDDGQRMWAPIASLEHTKTLANVTKARALQLRVWLDRVGNPVSSLDRAE